MLPTAVASSFTLLATRPLTTDLSYQPQQSQFLPRGRSSHTALSYTCTVYTCFLLTANLQWRMVSSIVRYNTTYSQWWIDQPTLLSHKLLIARSSLPEALVIEALVIAVTVIAIKPYPRYIDPQPREGTLCSEGTGLGACSELMAVRIFEPGWIDSMWCCNAFCERLRACSLWITYC